LPSAGLDRLALIRNISRVAFSPFTMFRYRDKFIPFPTSIGLPADALAVMVFAGHLERLPLNQTPALTMTLQKHMPALSGQQLHIPPTVGNNLKYQHSD
jgi:hypothetical protein